MRFIDTAGLQVDPDWQTRATTALDEARARPAGTERSKFIDGKAALWKELKPKLEGLSKGKCWYCEAKENRSDRHVDHFRPKNRVRDVDHNGYWWRAFTPGNYRLCCTYCNCERKDRETGEVGGKSDYFPLVDEATRVMDEVNDAAVQYELPVLLDPCWQTDVCLLWFQDDGRAVPKIDRNANVVAFDRADKSITFYHLDERELKDVREGLYNDIKEIIADGDFHFPDSLNGDIHAERGMQSVLNRLADMISPEAEFSACAEAVIHGFRSNTRPWLDGLHLLVQV